MRWAGRIELMAQTKMHTKFESDGPKGRYHWET